MKCTIYAFDHSDAAQKDTMWYNEHTTLMEEVDARVLKLIDEILGRGDGG